MITVYGVLSLSFMMLMYLFEKRPRASSWHSPFGCALSSSYGFLSGAWPFGTVEAIWTLIALRRWALVRTEHGPERDRRVSESGPGPTSPGWPGMEEFGVTKVPSLAP